MKSKTWKKWTKEDDEQLTKLSENNTKTEIAKMMGRSISSINNRLHSLEISCKSEIDGVWTEQEVKKLIRLSDNYTQSDIARIMKRTPSSVNNKLRSLDITGKITERTDKWTFEQITNVLGLGKGVVHKTFVKHGLKFRRRGYYCFVKEEDLLEFMKSHLDLWDATKAEYYIFSEYDWFLEKLEKDKKDLNKNKSYYWTDYQKQQFNILKRRGYTHKQIAERIGKTKKAVDQYSSTHKII